MKRFFKYILVMLLPLIILTMRSFIPTIVFLLGQEVRLSTEPVDPRDIFRGDFVNLRFSIESVSEDLLIDNEKHALKKSVTSVYVILKPDKDGIIHQPVQISLTHPNSGIYLKADAKMDFANKSIKLKYSNYLKRYYVKENTGRIFERASRQNKLVATVKIWRGIAVLVALDYEKDH